VSRPAVLTFAPGTRCSLAIRGFMPRSCSTAPWITRCGALTTAETVVSAALDAIMLTLRVKILDHRLPPGGSRYSRLRGQPESHLLVRHDCVWIVAGREAGAPAT